MDERETEAPKDDASDAEDADDIKLAQYLRRIGAKSLATEIDDLRFRNRIIESMRSIEFHEARLSYEEQLHDQIDRRLIANQAILFDKAQTYMNFVITLGYAGFFAIWNFVKDLMHPWDMKLVAVLLGASLFVFIIWTLFSMVVSGWAVNRVGKTIRQNFDSRDSMLEAIIAVEENNLVVGHRVQRLWFPTFILCTLTGFAAGAILLALLIANLFNWNFSVYATLLGS